MLYNIAFFEKNRQTPYFCIVFFIVLDLRLTRLGYRGIPFFMPLIRHLPKTESRNRCQKNRKQIPFP